MTDSNSRNELLGPTRRLVRDGRPPVLALHLALVVAFTALVLPTSAQSVSGVVSDSISGQPIEGALVVLLDSTGQREASALTEHTGRYRFTPGQGTFGIEVLRIGFNKWTSGPFTVGSDAPVELDISLPSRRIMLETIAVDVQSNCSVQSGGEGTVAVWDQVRNALNATAITIRDRLYRFTMQFTDRVLSPDGDIVSHRTQMSFGRSSWPFSSLPASQLEQEGFVQGIEDRDPVFYGPDPEVLLAPEFLRTHCFSLVREDQDGETTIGLRFEPADDRRLPDIRGTLWLREQSAELIGIQYEFTGLPGWGRDARGSQEYDRLPNGAWFIRKWSIYAPIPNLRGQRLSGVAGYRERSGMVRTIANSRGEQVRSYVAADSAAVDADGK